MLHLHSQICVAPPVQMASALELGLVYDADSEDELAGVAGEDARK